ncbi:MAG: cob(I)yrinic acid a,c-diamide adenosyltransferase [Candidatus Omnitrophota bacterium]|nr:cob(I)yrinic acid a,c-diamide adenosyltransferase [Candidatus Omnitrophota bacterium]
MKIYTAKGDQGKTSLLFGARISKSNLVIECLGCLDELNSFLGLAKAVVKSASFKKLIHKLQTDIYVISSEIAAKSENLNKLAIRFRKKRLLWLEKEINNLALKAKFKSCCFFVAGSNFPSAILDVCRTVCRRAERKLVFLNCKAKIKNQVILAYLNRLSSLLFVLVRAFEKKHKKFPSL